MVGARVVRPIAVDEQRHLQAIEDAADRILVEHLGAESWGSAPTGAERAALAGFILVVEDRGGAVAGFAHVLEVEGGFHLEQVAVHPDHGRRGHGRALVEQAKREAAIRGGHRMTLRTYAEVPWNAPFYETCGFTISGPDTPFHRGLVDVERDLGLDRYGLRVQMTAVLDQGSTAS